MSVFTANLILANLVHDEKYTRGVIPHLRTEYFETKNDKVIFNLINEYFLKYNRNPTVETLLIDLEGGRSVDDKQFEEISETIVDLKADPKDDPQWLLDTTEDFCQERAWWLAILQAAAIVEDHKKLLSKGAAPKIARSAIPKMMADVAAISFDTRVGHEFLADWERRFDFYHTKENRVPFDLEMMNLVTAGGLPNKTLTIIMGGTGVGKSALMNHMSAANLQDGKNVLYITLELAEEVVAQRIDANLMDIPIGDLTGLDREAYQAKIDRIQKKTKGRLFIKEYACASAGSAHFRHLLGELKMKKNFVPDIIYVDYLNICTSSRVKVNDNMYSHIMNIIQEMRGLATEFDLPIVSATQANREGNKSSDPETWNVSESFATPQTADFMIALVQNEEMKENGKMMVKQLKSRFGDANVHRRFMLGVEINKFHFYDVAQASVVGNAEDEEFPVMNWSGAKRVFDKSKFEVFS